MPRRLAYTGKFEAGWEEVTGVDGVMRIFGYVPSALPPRDFFLSVGESEDEAFGAIDSATWRGAALILAGLWAAIYVAWAGRRLVSSPTEGLCWTDAYQRPSNIECRVGLANLFVPVAIHRCAAKLSPITRFTSGTSSCRGTKIAV